MSLDDLVRGCAAYERVGVAWEGYDVVVEGTAMEASATSTIDRRVGPNQGATWWVESWWDLPDSPEGVDEVRRRVAAGPPR